METFTQKANQLSDSDLFNLGIELFNNYDCATEALDAVLNILGDRDESLLLKFDEVTA